MDYTGFVREVSGKDKNGRKVRKCWQVVVKYKDGEKWRQKTKVCHVRTKTEANKELTAWLEELNGAKIEKRETPSLTVSQAVADFLREHESNIEPSTLRGYKGSKKLIDEGIGSIPVADLAPKDIRAWISGLSKDYSASTAGKAYRLAKQVLRQLVIDEVIEKNVCDAVKAPKRLSGNPYALDGASIEKLVRLLQGMEKTPMVVAAYTSLYLGLRRGEICGLRWGDIDMRNRLMHVRRALGEATGGAYVKAPKNDSSARTIVIPEGLITVLEKRLERMRGDLLDAGIETTPEEMAQLYVIGTIDGRYQNPNLLGKMWRSFADDHGLRSFDSQTGKSRPCRFHDLRHSFGTMAASRETSKAGIKSVAASMGHSNASMTLNTYASVDLEDQKRLAEKMDAMLDFSGKEAVLKPSFRKTGTD